MGLEHSISAAAALSSAGAGHQPEEARARTLVLAFHRLFDGLFRMAKPLWPRVSLLAVLAQVEGVV